MSLAACNKNLKTASGDCTTQDGASINTHQVIGKWKKISGYSDNRSQATIALNHDILVVQPAYSNGVSRACLIPVDNGTPRSTALFKANYENDLDDKKVTYTFDSGGGSAPDTVANYSFAGSCGETRMTLNYANGESEVYEIINQEVTEPVCDNLSN